MNTPKRLILCLLTAALLIAAPIGCTKNETPDNAGDTDVNNPSTSFDPNMPIDEDTLNDLINEALKDGPILPEGDITEIWFDEIFRAFYPKQLDDIYPTHVYVYGELDTTQPVMCFCSQEISDLEVLSYEIGAPDEENVLYTVERLAPMEALVLQVEVGEQPNYLIRFRADDATYAYTVAQSADGNEIVLAPFAYVD